MYRVHSRWLAYCLNFEWFALPIGLGGLIGSIANVPLIFAGAWWLLLWWAMALTLLIVGIARPMHRRVGFTRQTLWVSDPR